MEAPGTGLPPLAKIRGAAPVEAVPPPVILNKLGSGHSQLPQVATLLLPRVARSI